MTTVRRASRPSRNGAAASLAAAGTILLLHALAVTAPAGAMPRVWQPLVHFDSADGLPQNDVLALGFDADGRLLAGTRFGLARYDGVDWRAITVGPEHPPSVGALALARDASVWIGTGGAGLHRLVGPRTAASSHPGVPATATVFALAPLADGRVWVGTADGLHRCGPDRCEPLPALAGRVVRSLWLDEVPEPVLWVGTEAGLRRVEDPVGPEPRLSDFRLGRADGIPNDIVIALRRWPTADGPL